MYLTAFPIITTTLGVTSFMFFAEASVVNGYLLYLSYRFHQDRNNSRARSIFLCSLWYLPFLLLAFTFHLRGENTLSLPSWMMQLKIKFRELCVHEMLITSPTNQKNENHALSSSIINEEAADRSKERILAEERDRSRLILKEKMMDVTGINPADLCIKLKSDEVVTAAKKDFQSSATEAAILVSSSTSSSLDSQD
jgi:hypothetical protein